MNDEDRELLKVLFEKLIESIDEIPKYLKNIVENSVRGRIYWRKHLEFIFQNMNMIII